MICSIIVPCYNEEAVLNRTIPALLSQDCSFPFEIIFVDDGSTDNTIEIIKSYMSVKSGNNGPEIILLQQNHRGPAEARNLAASKARGKILVFNDADMIPDRGYVRELCKPISDGVAKGTFTTGELVGNEGVYWADIWSIVSGCDIGHRYSRNHPDYSEVFRALLKSEFDSVGGYSDVGEGGVGEDFTVSRKLGYTAINVPAAVCHHDNPGTFDDFWRSTVWYGKGWYYKFGFRTLMASIIKRNPIITFIKCMNIRTLSLKKRFFYVTGLIVYDAAVIFGMISAMIGAKASK